MRLLSIVVGIFCAAVVFAQTNTALVESSVSIDNSITFSATQLNVGWNAEGVTACRGDVVPNNQPFIKPMPQSNPQFGFVTNNTISGTANVLPFVAGVPSTVGSLRVTCTGANGDSYRSVKLNNSTDDTLPIGSSFDVAYARLSNSFDSQGNAWIKADKKNAYCLSLSAKNDAGVLVDKHVYDVRLEGEAGFSRNLGVLDTPLTFTLACRNTAIPTESIVSVLRIDPRTQNNSAGSGSNRIVALPGYAITSPIMGQTFTEAQIPVSGGCKGTELLTVRGTSTDVKTISCSNSKYATTLTFTPSAPPGRKAIVVSVGTSAKAIQIINYNKPSSGSNTDTLVTTQPATSTQTTPSTAPVGTIPSASKITAELVPAPFLIAKGGKSRLIWRGSTNATTCKGVGFDTGGKISGSVFVEPAKTTEYAVVCSNSRDSVTARAAVQVADKTTSQGVVGSTLPNNSTTQQATQTTQNPTTSYVANPQCPVPFETLANGTLRDLKKTHPDVESNTVSYGPRYLIKDTLSPEGKPVFDSIELNKNGSRDSFETWYRDVAGVNQSMPFALELKDPLNTGKYTYSSTAFFPLDKKLYGNEGNLHNYHFTYEAHTSFTYKPGQVFKFTGDDDLWVFINGIKVIDLGGVHSPISASITLDTKKANELGLQSGKTYPFDIFFAERHTTQSNFKIETSIDFSGGCDIPESPTTPITTTPTTTNTTPTTPTTPITPVVIPSPTATIAADPSAIAQGASTVLTWSSSNADVCVGNLFDTKNAPSGSVTVSPSSTTNYSVKCTQNSTQKNAESVVVVSVTPVPPVTTTIETSAWEPSEVCGGKNTYAAKVKFSEAVTIKNPENTFVYIQSEGKNGIRRDLKLSYVKNNGLIYEYGDPSNQYKRFEYNDCGRSNDDGGSDISKRYFIPNGSSVVANSGKPINYGRFGYSGVLPASYVVAGSSLCGLGVCVGTPKVDITADKDVVTEDGTLVLLTITSENSLYCVLGGGEYENSYNTGVLNNEKKGTEGTYKVVQYGTTTYTATCTNGSGVSVSDSLTIREAKDTS